MVKREGVEDKVVEIGKAGPTSFSSLLCQQRTVLKEQPKRGRLGTSFGLQENQELLALLEFAYNTEQVLISCLEESRIGG